MFWESIVIRKTMAYFDIDDQVIKYEEVNLNQLYFALVHLAGLSITVKDASEEVLVEEPFFKILGKEPQPFGAPLDK